MDFRQYFKSRQGEIVHTLKQVVTRESPSQDKKAVDACSAFIAAEFKKTGARISRYPQKRIGDLYVLEYPASVKAAEAGQILVLTHIDTVWPVGKIAKMPFYISGDKIFGPGVLDMKAGLAMTLFAFKAIHQLSLRTSKRIAVFVNAAEETGYAASHNIIAQLARKAALVLCLEPSLPGGALKTQRKGRLVIRLEVKGRAAHSGTPEKGINAIEELVYQVRSLKKLATGGTTLSVNQIGGGEKPNIVADSAWSVMDIRFWTSAQKDRIIHAFKHLKAAKPGAKFSCSVESLTPPMEKTKASAQLFQRVKKIASLMEIPLVEGKTGGGSDASIASSLGIPTLDGMGPDGDGIHAEHEHVLLPSLIQRTALLTELLLQL
jgi:glutamate carboxypeptidase